MNGEGKRRRKGEKTLSRSRVASPGTKDSAQAERKKRGRLKETTRGMSRTVSTMLMDGRLHRKQEKRRKTNQPCLLRQSPDTRERSLRLLRDCEAQLLGVAFLSRRQSENLGEEGDTKAASRSASLSQVYIHLEKGRNPARFLELKLLSLLSLPFSSELKKKRRES